MLAQDDSCATRILKVEEPLHTTVQSFLLLLL